MQQLGCVSNRKVFIEAAECDFKWVDWKRDGPAARTTFANDYSLFKSQVFTSMSCILLMHDQALANLYDCPILERCWQVQ
jgi:hypothetical protein